MYCENRREQWFDRAQCTSATRRTLFRTSLLAHRLPPGCPVGASYRCPAKGCDFVITAESETAELARFSAMTENERGREELARRKSHTSVLPGRVKLSWCDHVKRQMSLLHFNLNSCGSTLVVAYAAGATKAQKVAMNACLEKHKSLYRFRTSPKDREKKTPGNVVRHLLWTPGLMLSLATARYGPPVSAAEKAAAAAVAAAVDRGADLATDSDMTPPPPPPLPPPPPVSHGMDLASLLAMSVDPAHTPPLPLQESLLSLLPQLQTMTTTSSAPTPRTTTFSSPPRTSAARA